MSPIDLHVFISSKNTHNFVSSYNILFSCLNFFSFILSVSNAFHCGITSLLIKLSKSTSLVPACIFFILILFVFPLFLNSDNFLIRDVLPHPVSPIIITGILDLILNKIKTILIKLSAVIT